MKRADEFIDDLAGRVSDGLEVDWDEAESRALDDEQRRAISQLRIVAQVAGAFREEQDSPSTETAVLPPETTANERIGPYRILKKVGQGGMGEVFEAEQERPIRRRVALKLIKAGMDTKHVVARFESERQALALMSHPNVARVFDAGATRRGLPYFAMEYIRGEPITRYCDRHRLSTPERLELFLQVCEGVQHAHLKGIIHRDIKPSNVLVQIGGERPVPKIIDFGVAKATAQPLTEKTMFTQLGALIGTPEYMSPEQAEMTDLDVDTRTDVYALGVMLYELLVGTLPFDRRALRKASFDEIRRMIREDEPPRPSTRLSRLGESSTESAHHRRTDLSTLQRLLRGDLDWITMKALEKDRTRRYGSANELAADIRRHLQYEPVQAGPPSTAYRAKKFVRRHRIGVAAASAIVLAVLGFVAMMTVQTRRIAAERDRANRERETAEQASEFLAGTLGNVDSFKLGLALQDDLRQRLAETRRQRGVTEIEIERALVLLDEALSDINVTDAAMRLLDDQILSPAGDRVAQDASIEPRIAGRLEHELGLTYVKLGLRSRAIEHFERAAQIRSEANGEEHPDTLTSRCELGMLYWAEGRASEAEPLLRDTAEVQARVLGPEHRDTLKSRTHLGWALYMQSRYEQAEELLRATLETQRNALGSDDVGTITTMNILAGTYLALGRLEEAERLQREAVERSRRVLGDEHYKTLAYINTLAIICSSRGDLAEAAALQTEASATRRRVLGGEHPSTLNATNNLANILLAQGRFAEAERLSRETLATSRRLMGEEHGIPIASRELLTLALVGKGRYADAETLLHESLDFVLRNPGASRAAPRDYLYELGLVSLMQHRHEAALDWLERASKRGFSVTDFQSNADSELFGAVDESNGVLTLSLYYLGRVAADAGDREAALTWLRAAVEREPALPEPVLAGTALEFLRGDPEFEALVARARDNQGP